jgi:hypothetical protein
LGNFRRPEGDQRKFLHVEEVRAFEVSVALGIPSRDRRGIDFGNDARLSGVFGRDRHAGFADARQGCRERREIRHVRWQSSCVAL